MPLSLQYTQQSYAFGHVGLCMYAYMYVNKNRLFSALPVENLPNLFRYMYFLTEFKHLQSGLLPPVCCTDRANHFFPK